MKRWLPIAVTVLLLASFVVLVLVMRAAGDADRYDSETAADRHEEIGR